MRTTDREYITGRALLPSHLLFLFSSKKPKQVFFPSFLTAVRRDSMWSTCSLILVFFFPPFSSRLYPLIPSKRAYPECIGEETRLMLSRASAVQLYLLRESLSASFAAAKCCGWETAKVTPTYECFVKKKVEKWWRAFEIWMGFKGNLQNRCTKCVCS